MLALHKIWYQTRSLFDLYLTPHLFYRRNQPLPIPNGHRLRRLFYKAMLAIEAMPAKARYQNRIETSRSIAGIAGRPRLTTFRPQHRNGATDRMDSCQSPEQYQEKIQ